MKTFISHTNLSQVHGYQVLVTLWGGGYKSSSPHRANLTPYIYSASNAVGVSPRWLCGCLGQA